MMENTRWIFLASILLLSPMIINAHYFGTNEVASCGEYIDIEDSPNGTIQSLGYPEPYPENRYCEVIFKGDKQHKIVITFVQDFYLRHPSGKHHKKHTSCKGIDILKVYDGLTDKAKVLGEYCGVAQPLSLMSSGAELSLRLTSYSYTSGLESGLEPKGYRAKYSFISDYGIKTGKQKEKGKCFFEFQSSVKKEGIITSPNPGGIYPRNTNCSYVFTGTFFQRVFLKFHYFDLEGIEPCTEQSGSDFLEFSNDDFDQCPSRRCGRFTPQEIVSNGPYFRVTFRSNDRLNGLGFSASYKFLSDEELPEWANYLRGSADAMNPVRHFLTLLLWLIISISGKFS